jgi:hypothetical protein
MSVLASILDLTCMDDVTLRVEVVEPPEKKSQVYLRKSRREFAAFPALYE